MANNQPGFPWNLALFPIRSVTLSWTLLQSGCPGRVAHRTPHNIPKSSQKVHLLWGDHLASLLQVKMAVKWTPPVVLLLLAFQPLPPNLQSNPIHFWLRIKDFLLQPGSANPRQCLVYCLLDFMVFWRTEWADMSVHYGEFPGISSTVKKNFGIKALRQLQLKNKF